MTVRRAASLGILGALLLVAPSVPFEPLWAAPGSAAAILRAAGAMLGTVTHVGGLHTTGTLAASGQRGTFASWLDLANGHNATHVILGPLTGDQGYDGAAWSASNGITTVNDLPATQAENVTAAYLALDSWAATGTGAQIGDEGTRRDGGTKYRVIRVVPPGGVPARLWFDAATHLLARTDVDADAGTVTDRYSDYRVAGGMRIPYRDVNRAADGTLTTTVVTEARIEPLPKDALARTPSMERGSIVGGATRAAMPFRLSLGTTGNVVIPVSLAGRAPVEMVFDTGGRNVLTPSAARALGFSGSGGLEVGGVGESTERATVANVGTIAAGAAVLTEQQAFVLPMPYSLGATFAHETVDGLVGFEMLSNFQTTIDYQKQTITFAPFATSVGRPDGAAIVPLRSNEGTPYVEAEIDGVKGLFMLDTGNAGDLVVFKTFADAHRLFADATSLSYVSAGGVGGLVRFRRLRAGTFVIAGTTLRAPIVEVTDQKSGAFASQTLAGNIGAAVLRRFAMQLNYRDRTIAFAPNASANDAFEADRTGLSLSRDAEGFLIVGVTPGTPAAAAGLAAGDRIVAVDGTPVDALSAADVYRVMRNRSVTKVRLSIVRKGTTAPAGVTIAPRTLL